ncbi:MAG: GSCFA domain-containing protein [Lentisphaeria bacterium]|nr:GSCFA domain-containing protein [Lentisphaeria bacterium]
MGSCFAERVGGKLLDARLPIYLNPAGVVYNPLCIAACLSRLVEGRCYSESDLIEADGLWCSLDHHGAFSSPIRKRTLAEINQAFKTGIEALAKAKWLFLTFGTAYVYEHRGTGRPVANCHRLPADQFDRTLARSPRLVDAVTAAVTCVRSINPDIHLLLTVSPVRHLRDSAPLNQLSKAQLITACHDLCDELDRCFYFPAYEIVLDELRDYRFFDRSLTHPNDVAVDIIWERFQSAVLNERARVFIEKYAPLLRDINHKHLHPDTPQARQFDRDLTEKIRALAEEFPEVTWSSREEPRGTRLRPGADPP